MRILSRGAVAAACLITVVGALAQGVSTQFTVTGAVQTPATYDAASLMALPAVTQTDTFMAGTGSQTHTYTGPTMWSVLGNSGIVTGPAKNDILNRYVLATGSDGYKVVYSMGELDPSFGNVQAITADEETINGVTAPLGSDGFARTTAPLDIKGGRYDANLVNLDVRASASQQAGVGGGTSSAFTVSGTVLNPGSFNLAALQALPQVTETVGGNTYTGVNLWSFLNTTVGLQLDPNIKNDVLQHYVVATGTDGYKALFSLGELDADFGNQPDLIAFEENGQDLTDDGFARIVAPNDAKQGRWVSNLMSLEVFTASPVPEPGPFALMLCGLGLLAFRRRVGRKLN